MTRRHIPLADTATLERPLRRTRLVRLGLAAAVALTAAAAVAAALALRPAKPNLVPSGTSGIVVLDVSASIGERTHRQIAHTLASAAGTRDRYGLVVFSDTAYEALPPGTPGAELLRFARLFTPAEPELPTGPGTQGLTPVGAGGGAFGRRGGGFRGGARGGGFRGASPFPASPWRPGFSAGTRISTGLLLARRILERDGVERGSILLVSDLDDDQPDIASLTQAVLGIRAAGIPLRVVALSPDARNRSLFARLLADATAITAAPVRRAELEPPPPFDRVRAPLALAAASILLLVLLAANELLGARLDWRPRAPAGDAA